MKGKWNLSHCNALLCYSGVFCKAYWEHIVWVEPCVHIKAFAPTSKKICYWRDMGPCSLKYAGENTAINLHVWIDTMACQYELADTDGKRSPPPVTNDLLICPHYCCHSSKDGRECVEWDLSLRRCLWTGRGKHGGLHHADQWWAELHRRILQPHRVQRHQKVQEHTVMARNVLNAVTAKQVHKSWTYG